MIIDIQQHAASVYPNECCGLVVNDHDGQLKYVPCVNSHEKPAEYFRIDKDEYMRVLEEYGEPVASVHSHPNASAQPSHADRLMCEATDLTMHIVGIGQIQLETGVGYEFSEIVTVTPCGWEAPLIGREFMHGVLDCWALVQDYLGRNYGVTFPHYQREDDWWDKGQDLYSPAALRAAGFYEIGEAEMQPGDMIVMQIKSKDVPNHAGVYIGDGIMLHHLYGRLSERVVYGGYWRDHTRYIVRHREVKQ